MHALHDKLHCLSVTDVLSDNMLACYIAGGAGLERLTRLLRVLAVLAGSRLKAPWSGTLCAFYN